MIDAMELVQTLHVLDRSIIVDTKCCGHTEKGFLHSKKRSINEGLRSILGQPKIKYWNNLNWTKMK